jgi:ATP-binding cassette, subfamily B, multidrug efflux pump
MKREESIKNLNQREVFKRLLGYTKPHKKALIVAFILLFLTTGTTLVGPILVQIFIDDYLTPRIFDFWPIFWLAASYLLLHIASVFINYFQLLSFQTIALKIIRQLRVDVFSRVHKLGLSFFDKTSGGSLVSRITNDTEAIKDLYVSVLSVFVQNFVFLLGIFAAMFYLNVKLALFCLILLPMIFGVMMLYRKLSSKYYFAMRDQLSQLNAKLNESLQGMSVIQAFRQEKRLRKEFGLINKRHFDAAMKNMKLDGLLLRPAVDFINILALILVLSFFGISSFNSPIEIGVLYAFVNYLDRFFEPINMLMQRLSIFQQAIVAAGRVFFLLDETELAPTASGKEEPKITNGEIEFKNVTFSYDGKQNVLKNISFKAKPGDTVALVGHTGSGKSSITNLLMRFYPLKHGEILIDGTPLQSFQNDELRNKIGLVLQDPFIFVGDIKQNIRLYNDAISDEKIEEAGKFVQAESFISKLEDGYNHQLGERGSTFSSGQRQLISFARTMAMEPKILVLDEATASIDTETEELIQNALEKMRKGRTTIAIAHRLSTIQDADLILVLHKGKIVEQGTHEELLKKEGLYHKMYLLQQGTSGQVSITS